MKKTAKHNILQFFLAQIVAISFYETKSNKR